MTRARQIPPPLHPALPAPPRTAARLVRTRALLLWVLLTGVLTATGALLLPAARTLPAVLRAALHTDPSGPAPTAPTAPAEVVVAVCATIALPVLARLGVAVSLGALDALAMAGGRPVPGRRGVRGWTLAACGALAVGTLSPAVAAPGVQQSTVTTETAGVDLDGLPLPVAPVVDRREVRTRPSTAGPTPGSRPRALTTLRRVAPGRTVTLRPGDSVWRVARADLGPGASRAEVARHWRRVLRLNAETLAPDPDLVHAGDLLRLPRSPR